MKQRFLALVFAAVMLFSIAGLSMVSAEDSVTLRWVGAGWSQNDKAVKILEKWHWSAPSLCTNQ